MNLEIQYEDLLELQAMVFAVERKLEVVSMDAHHRKTLSAKTGEIRQWILGIGKIETFMEAGN